MMNDEDRAELNIIYYSSNSTAKLALCSLKIYFSTICIIRK